MPLTDADLDAAAAALGRPIPETYRRFARECPRAEFHRHFPKFYASAKDLIRFNRGMVRLADERSVTEADGAGGWTPFRPWPPEWLVVGDNDGDYFWFVRPDVDGLWTWEHDGGAVRLVSESLAAALAQAQAARGSAPVLETRAHPTLGELAWDAESGYWAGRLGGVGLWLRPGTSERESFLEAAAPLVPALVAAEPGTLRAALDGGARVELLEIAGGEVEPAGLLAWHWLVVAAKAGGVVVEFHYRPADALKAFGIEMLFVDADAEGGMRGWHWLM